MSSNYKLRAAVRLALCVGSGALAFGSAPTAIAQDDAASESIEEITVTGSRIKRADLDSASPVTVLDRADILAQGITDVGNLIQRMPAMSGSPLGTTVNNGNTEEGIVQIDLRGLGVDRTVTLINGKRTVDRGDYTTIPSIMIERVEILKDGASAVYGADAVAGVVNIITRKDFEGVNIDLQTADWFDTDNADQQSIALIAGKTFDEGNFIFGMEYIDQKEAFQRDVPWDYMQGSYYIYYDSLKGCENQPAAEYTGTGDGGCYFFGSSRIPESFLRFENNAGPTGSNIFMIPEPGAVMAEWDGRTFNYAPVNYIQTPYQRTNIFAEANFDVTENVRFNASIRANERISDQELAPLPYDDNLYPAWSGFFNGEFVDGGISDQNFYLREAVDRYNAANGTSLPYEPIINIRRRMTETPRHYHQEVTQYQAVVGFEGELTLGDSELGWDAYYNKGYRSMSSQQLGQFSGQRLQNSLGPSADFRDAVGSLGSPDGTPECYVDINDSASFIPDCVPLNMFGGEGTVSAEMLDYIAVTLVESRLWTQDIFGMSVTGEFGDLQGGPFGWAAGYAYRDDTFRYTPDSNKTLGTASGGDAFPTDGALTSNSIFLEGYAPLFDNGTQSLALKGGYRYDDYNIFGDDTTWQLGVEFQALETLKLRATAGTVFRAPTIVDLFEGLQDDAPSYNDPCDATDFDPSNGVAIAPGCEREAIRRDTQTTGRIGGSPALVPETGETLTAGFVWTPDIRDYDLSFTVDYWQVEIDDAITTYGVQNILDLCYIEQRAEFCPLIFRRNDVDFSIDEVIDTNVNVASQTAKGIDIEARFDFDTSFGQFETAMLWAHMLERTRTDFPGAPVQKLEGTHTNITANDGGTYAENKINFSAHWYRGDFSVGYLAEYIDSITAEGTTRLTLGVTNLTDEEPPYIDTAFNANTDTNTYRMFGTGYFFRISQTFD
jgi:outer membrane receptor protein involved in Fe transport